ncbi:carbonic anhydrase [Microvirga sesbaniae]|uniref:carbonic anhydrase n=1 Tax=Microvirga sesbaniae TaxID=681392 RepID=UPI0021CA07ED|nr:carbonic anhydrase [Microvirga sp. HBU67692]
MCIECVRMNRRTFMSLVTTGAAASMWTISGRSSSAFARTGLSADEALARLKAGNDKFVNAPQLCEVGLREERASTAGDQSPWATILTCSDSRVAPELIFGGVGLGELFVARNAGNVADTAVLGTIEYGAEHLGSPLVVVLGHQRCGAVQAACDVVANHVELQGSIRPMVEAIVPAAKSQEGKPGDFVDNTVRENARRNAAGILAGSDIIRELVHEGQVKVVHGYYDLERGTVDFID